MDTQKIVINRCWGGFGLSRAAWMWLREHGLKEAIETPLIPGETWSDGSVFTEQNDEAWGNSHAPYNTPRNDPLLIECIETLGVDVASGDLAKLKIVEIPVGIQWEINDYDGMETVEEVHNSWS